MPKRDALNHDQTLEIFFFVSDTIILSMLKLETCLQQ